jgi:acyl carrier protein
VDRSEILEKIKGVVVDQLGVEADKVTEQATFIEDLGADSLDLVEVVMAFEDEFGISIPDTALEGIKTVGEAADYISAHIDD